MANNRNRKGINNRIQNPYNLKDMYEKYEETHKDNPVYEVSREWFYDICDEFYTKVVEHILEKGKEFQMPYSLGSINVIKYKPELSDIKKRLSFIDWNNTYKLGKYVYHLNEHTNGYKYTIKWSKKKNMIKYVDIYKFVGTRRFKRRLAAIIKNKEFDYLEID
ncbi:MAG TPA: hypothetical protein VJ907_04300 [Halanaerobiales bacterium]|nr:hypothetical protein [Halanaerobiales bacterium]